MGARHLLYFMCGLVSVSAHSESQGYPQEPVLTTPSGSLRGSVSTSRLGKKFYSFRSIRYAEPPVGELRFQPPIPYGKWEGVYDATQDMPPCPQRSLNNTSEDCLMLNVYTTKLPEPNRKLKRPVIVFIHDGGFYSITGNSHIRGPEYLIDQDIVLVGINYRLVMLGFLSTGDELAPGNNGMKDQVLALRWIQQNIEAFGGDKDNVTLLGYSAGSRSIILHMVSPMTRGLFHKGICMSASPLGVYPIPDNQLDLAKKQASFLGCPTDTSRNMINCLKTKSAQEIADSQVVSAEISYNPIIIQSPVIEKDFGQERYLTEHPIKLIKEGNFHKVPIINGRNRDEFVYKAFQIVANETARRMLEENFGKYAPIILCYERDTERSRRVSQGVRDFYLGGRPVSNETVIGLGQAYADAIIGFGVDRAIKLLAEYNDKPVYQYLTTYLGPYTEFYLPGSNNTVPFGVVHQDEIDYLFYIHGKRPFFNQSYPIESRTVSKLTKLWANFARTGNPTPERTDLFDNILWEPYNLRSQKYLDFGARLRMRERMFERRYSFWERYYPLSEY